MKDITRIFPMISFPFVTFILHLYLDVIKSRPEFCSNSIWDIRN